MVYTEDYLKEKLTKELEAEVCEIKDQSDGCGGKFDAVIVSKKFEGIGLLARHRMVNEILKEELKEILEEIDEDGSGEIEFEEFCQLCAKFLIEEPDEETMKHDLKEAFRVYDKEANGFITTDTLREIISELDQRLTKEDLEILIEEIDEDGSGTMDFDEFCDLMMS
jgi:stress-induced morphogen